MKMAAGLSVVVLLLVCTFLPVHSQGIRTEPQKQIDEWMIQNPSGAVAVAVVTPENTEYYFATDNTPSSPGLPNENTIFEIGSITKGFTGTLLADQVLSGNVLLTDTLDKLLTDWPGRSSSPVGKITLLELATHSSGLPRIPDNLNSPLNPYANYTAADLYEWLDEVKLVNIGDYLYSNVGAGLLGHSLDVYKKKNFADLLKERVLIPLGLRDTDLTLNADQERRRTPGHGEEGELVPQWDFDVLAPAGGLKSTVADFVHFLRFATGIDEPQKPIRDALDFAIRPRHATTIGNDTIGYDTIGLFWNQRVLPRGTLIWHNGGTGGYTTFVGWVPEQQIGIVAFCSNNGGLDELSVAILKQKLDF